MTCSTCYSAQFFIPKFSHIAHTCKNLELSRNHWTTRINILPTEGITLHCFLHFRICACSIPLHVWPLLYVQQDFYPSVSFLQASKVRFRSTTSTNKNRYLFAWAMEMVRNGELEHITHQVYDSQSHKVYTWQAVFSNWQCLQSSWCVHSELQALCAETAYTYVEDGQHVLTLWKTMGKKYSDLPGVHKLHDFLIVQQHCFTGAWKESPLHVIEIKTDRHHNCIAGRRATRIAVYLFHESLGPTLMKQHTNTTSRKRASSLTKNLGRAISWLSVSNGSLSPLQTPSMVVSRSSGQTETWSCEESRPFCSRPRVVSSKGLKPVVMWRIPPFL